ncbi:hypothetical protein Nepgr_024040 [Nepenthes gracilis]|uniref:Uncharacterized protein n=1 Tax=Nepenthes gracilis TaxID=150966 RepID=A0AAD3XY90_NEPGR|nr:hypothetical protein Nepgr_024040 [Nepenthes gracilis]
MQLTAAIHIQTFIRWSKLPAAAAHIAYLWDCSYSNQHTQMKCTITFLGPMHQQVYNANFGAKPTAQVADQNIADIQPDARTSVPYQKALYFHHKNLQHTTPPRPNGPRITTAHPDAYLSKHNQSTGH